MPPSTSSCDPPEFLHLFIRIDQVRRWLQGDRVRVEAYLERYPDLRNDRALLLDVISAEMLLREQHGEPLDPEEYVRRFPEHTEALRRQFALHRAVDGSAMLEGRSDTIGSLPVAAAVAAPAAPSPPDGTVAMSDAAAIATANASLGTQELWKLPGYEILGRLGAGGMGVVYKAHHLRLNRVVALKMVLHAEHAQAQDLLRFLAEPEAVAHLQHPNVVQLFDSGQHNGLPYFTLEFVSGGTLAGRLREQPLPPQEAARIVQQIALGVQHAHEHGIVHRDLKPANVLMTSEGTPKVADFGLARRLETGSGVTATGTVMGTPSYMAPEQAAGDMNKVGPAADVYALGAILYECLTGKPPFRAPTQLATLLQVRTEEPAAVHTLQPNVPRDLETICHKCLHKEPARRYQSAAQVADDLGRFLDGRPVWARPIGPQERLVKWIRRKPAVAALAGLVAAVAVLGVAGILYEWGRAETARRAEVVRADAEATARQDVEQQLYLNRIALADRELADGKVAWAQEQLDRCPDVMRQWEWFYLQARCRGQQAQVLRGHTRGISSLTATRDGSLVASAAGDGTVRLWDTKTGEELASLQGHRGGVNWVAFDSGGGSLASAGEDGRVVLWDVTARREQQVLEGQGGPLSCVAFHPTKRLLAVATFGGNPPGEVSLRDLETGHVVHRLAGHKSRLSSLAFSPTGKLLATASHDETVRLWDVSTGEEQLIFSEHRRPLASVAFSPDGRFVASAGGRFQSDRPEDGEILVWDAGTGAIQQRLRGHAGRPVSVQFSPEGRRLATAGWDGEVKLWNLPGGEEVLSLKGHLQPVMSVIWGDGGGSLVSGSLDGLIRIWKAPR